MSVQCAAHAVRGLAALPAPITSPRRRVSRVHISPLQTGRAPALLVRATDSSSPPATQAPGSAAGKTVVPDDEFSLAKVSFGVIGLVLGISLLSYGFGSYFNLLPGSEWSALLLTYGFPLTIIGMALKYAELKPVPCITYSDALALREKCATPILKQVRSDVTRFRYGDEQHLDEALQRIFQYGLGGGVPRRNAPILQKIREEVLLLLLSLPLWDHLLLLLQMDHLFLLLGKDRRTDHLVGTGPRRRDSQRLWELDWLRLPSAAPTSLVSSAFVASSTSSFA